MKQIELTGRGRGQFALVDDEDYESLSGWAWHLGTGGYAVGYKGKMHRIIMNAQKGFVVDHGNHNRLDNRKCNLIICTIEQNNKNRSPYGASSRFKGVSKTPTGRWAVAIKPLKSKRIYLGTYDSEIQAARVYNVAAEHFHGNHTYLNPVGNWWEMKWEDLERAWILNV